jgi:hypothetical protein
MGTTELVESAIFTLKLFQSSLIAIQRKLEYFTYSYTNKTVKPASPTQIYLGKCTHNN